jgi:hypothetical protein
VVAGGLALAAAEGKPDDTMLVALVADPADRRRLRATQAALLVGIGGLLAVLAGPIPARVIIQASNEMRFAIRSARPAGRRGCRRLASHPPARWSFPATWAA